MAYVYEFCYFRFFEHYLGCCIPISNRSMCKPGRKHYPREIQKLAVKKRKLWRKHHNNPSDLDALWSYRNCAQQYRIACCNVTALAEEQVIQVIILVFFISI